MLSIMVCGIQPFLWEQLSQEAGEIYQSITLIDATAFNLQWNNMRSIIAETVKYTDMVIFNRCKSGMDLGSYRRSMRALN